MHEHFSGESEDQRFDAGSGLLAAQKIQTMHDFQRVACGIGQGLVHVGDEGRGFDACAIGDFYEGAGQLLGFVGALHEGAIAEFDVQHQRFKARGELSDRMEAVIRGTESTVAVTSLMA